MNRQSQIAAYPRKGTITSHQSARRTTCTDYSLSPQGDDNLTKLMVWGVQFNYSLSPQGDDNSFLSTYTIYLRDCSLSPQGDDNEQVLSVRRKSSHCSLSPQGDDNREGAKNSASKKMRSFSFANLNSLFSVGCPSMNGTIAAAVIFSLLRLLHSDKMCYNKANSKHLLQN